MKNLISLITTLMFLFLAGCSDKMETKQTKVESAPFLAVPTDGSSYVPPTVGPGQSPGWDQNYSYGATASLVIEGGSAYQKNERLADYANHSVNNPTNIHMNMNFDKVGNNWGGVVTIDYDDTLPNATGYFYTGNTQEEVILNVWYRDNGKPVFHAVLEDYLGAVVIVIDDFIDFGDGGDAQASGSIWYKNFNTDPRRNVHPPSRCWFVGLKKSETVYDCRPWPRYDKSWDKKNDTYASVNPALDSGYTKLGEFSGLDLQQAFNGQFDMRNVD